MSYAAVPKVALKFAVVPVSVGVYESVKVPLPRSELAFTNPPSAALVPYSITYLAPPPQALSGQSFQAMPPFQLVTA